MFEPNFYIDAVQETKRIVTNQIIKDPTLNKAANDYIAAQTAFAKMLTRNAIDITKHSVESVGKFLLPELPAVTKAARAKAAKAESSAAHPDTNTQGE